jgi:mannose-6-phosphate isomerase-like protein (cupin superfamily)
MSLFQQAEPFVKHYIISNQDLTRPWGGFYYIDKIMLSQFIKEYFQELSVPTEELDLSPKILVIAPGKRLSWQYHHRRKEIWSVLQGPVGVIRSPNNEETSMTIHMNGDIIMIDVEERHRLIGLNSAAIVAELWWHIDSTNPSDESDIIRLQDDFKR